MKLLLQPVTDYLADTWAALRQGWDRFWFTPADPTTVAVIRIVVGLVVLWVHLTVLPDVMNFIGPEAWVDAKAAAELREVKQVWEPTDEIPIPVWQGIESIWFHIQDPVMVWATYLLFLAAALCFTLGLFSRTSSVIVWIGHISYVQRAWVIFYGMDSIIALLTLYLMFAPIGATLSLDAIWTRRRRQLTGSRGRLHEEISPRPSVAANFVTRLIQVHMCVVYICAGMSKLMGAMWWNGVAIYYTLVPEFSWIDVKWITGSDWLWQVVSHIGVFFTLFTEVTFAFLIWHRRLRPLMLFCAFMLQFGIGAFMGLGSFQMAMFAGCLAFIPPESMRWFLETVFKRDAPAKAAKHDQLAVPAAQQ